ELARELGGGPAHLAAGGIGDGLHRIAGDEGGAQGAGGGKLVGRGRAGQRSQQENDRREQGATHDRLQDKAKKPFQAELCVPIIIDIGSRRGAIPPVDRRIEPGAGPFGQWSGAMSLLISILITFVVATLALSLANLLPIDSRAKQIVQAIVVIIGILSLLRYLVGY